MSNVSFTLGVISSCCFFFLHGCGSSPDVEVEKKAQSHPQRLAGRVERVNKSNNFVLIRRYGPWRVGDGEVVVSAGGGRTANLLPTGEKRGEHIAADIRSGEIEIGDAVYIRQISVKSEPQVDKSLEKSDDSETLTKKSET